MGQVKITWGPAGNSVLWGEYTLSRGITPSAISLTCVPFEDRIPAVSDVSFCDGGTVLTFRDCGFAGKAVSRSGGGTVWTIQLYDGRWRWKFGILVAEYNRIINARLLSVGPNGEVPPEEAADSKSARDLAKFLLGELSVTDFDVDALPADDFPFVSWDHIRPADALAALADSYELVICYDPTNGRVELAKTGEGEELPTGPKMLSDDIADAERLKPKTIKAICAPTQHEEEFELEAVGLDTDGSVKPIGNLSYRPAGGWESDFMFLSGVPETAVADPNDPAKTTTIRALAEESVWRWYRIKKQAGNWTIKGWKKFNSERVTLQRLLPVKGELLDPFVFTGTGADAGVVKTKRKSATVRGIHAADWKGMGATNSAATESVAESFSIDEDEGIVKFSLPVFKWDNNLPAEPTLYLRCIVTGDRYVREKAAAGTFGVEGLDCGHLVMKYKNGAVVNNIAADADAILAKRLKDYEDAATGSRTYAGIMDFQVDGLCPQITWSIGPSGATTQAGQASEHNPWVASEGQRRAMELQRFREWRSSLAEADEF